MVDRDPERPDDDLDPDAPASAEEVAASKRLRDALEGGAAGDASPEIDLALALRAAWAPSALSADESRAMLDATPSAEEQDLAVQLRDALASNANATATAPATLQLAQALRAAFAPAALDETEHRAILDAALAKMPATAARKTPAQLEKQASTVVAMKRRATVVRVAFGFVAGGLALAASVVLVVTNAPGPGSEALLAKARTTQPLFSEPFKAGETSARIDRIASARAGDFRDNRFTKWGVR
jgi:hypothetical protein